MWRKARGATDGGTSEAAQALRESAHELTGARQDYDPLLELVGDARFVLLGEASHGTHEFYRGRAEITQRLVAEKGFTAVAVEADWPDAYRVNRYARGLPGADESADEALGGFKRFPTWMWRNADVLDFVGWLRAHNDSVAQGTTKVGFYGLDLYSLHASIEAVLGYLGKVDPEAARRAQERYSCFEHFGRDPQSYGYATAGGAAESCEDEVLNQLTDLRRRASDYANRDGQLAADEFFFAEQNARLVANAEEYYRSMFRGRVSSWNLRDTHMFETLDALSNHLQQQTKRPAKIVVWAHNSHLGDARATEMGDMGELNLGQLTREHHADETVLVGWSTYTGSVTAANNWDEPPQRKQVRPGLRGSYEELFHETGLPRFLVNLRDDERAREVLSSPRLQRAIGVIYRPETERQSHYFRARLTEQFDCLIHIDETRAVEPLERTRGWQPRDAHEDAPETYPSGI